jgi:hypothetical protein
MSDSVYKTARGGPSRAKILIVDDEPAVVMALCEALEAEAYSTAGAASGPDALAMLKAAAPDPKLAFDILITDLTMPEMDGIALLRAAGEVDAHLVSIVITGHSAIETAVEAMKAGALDYIAKPFNLSAIRPVLARARSVRVLRLANATLQQRVAEQTEKLEAANRELRAANQELEAFTHTVSHDLRVPLNRLIDFSESLLDKPSGAVDPEYEECLGNVLVGGRRVLRFIEDLMRFSELERRPLSKELVRVSELVNEVLGELRAPQASREIETLLGALPDAFADASLLRQVFVSLLSNAFKFTRRKAQAMIKVEGREESGFCLYSVQDNGAGFDGQSAHRLFHIFQRMHAPEDFEGSGVGLAIAQRIVERHGGEIRASAEVGKGATFTFSLPAMQRHAMTVPQSAKPCRVGESR